MNLSHQVQNWRELETLSSVIEQKLQPHVSPSSKLRTSLKLGRFFPLTSERLFDAGNSPGGIFAPHRRLGASTVLVHRTSRYAEVIVQSECSQFAIFV